MSRRAPMRLLPLAAALAAAGLSAPLAQAWPTGVRVDERGMVVAQRNGFDLRLAPELAADAALRERTLATLAEDLDQIERILPPAPLALLRARVTIWIERQGATVAGGMSGRGMVYHPSAIWLKSNGLDPRRAGGVEIVRAEDYLEWRAHQPMMVLHELAHAYHHLIGIEHPTIASAYETARGSAVYDAVGYVLAPEGERRPAYAMNSPMEYFAELSEAYFGRNDYEPFDREGLRNFDPGGYAMVESLWSLGVLEIRAAMRAAFEAAADRAGEPAEPPRPEAPGAAGPG